MIEMLLAGKPNTILGSEKRMGQLIDACVDVSHADIRTIILNAMRQRFLLGGTSIRGSDVLKELVVFKRHGQVEQDDLIRALLGMGCTHRELNEEQGFPLRRIQAVSKEL
jgi:hypothetical protein